MKGDLLARSERPHSAPKAVALVIDGRVARADIPRLCERARALVEASDAEVVVCDVGAVANPDAVLVDALARLQLTALRLGCRMWVGRPTHDLRDLVTLMGLARVLPFLVLEPGGQSKEGEQAGGVEEEADPGDVPVG